jgi:hypothetical protein
MTGTATAQRPTYAADAYGGQVPTFAALLSDFPCTVQPKSGREVGDENGQRVMHRMFNLYTPTDITSVRTGDRIVFNSANYLVESVEDMGGRGTHFKLELLKKD